MEPWNSLDVGQQTVAGIAATLIAGTIIGVWNRLRIRKWWHRLRARRATSKAPQPLPGFVPFTVREPSHSVEWRIQTDPTGWQDMHAETFGPAYVRQVITGPFHLKDNCQADVRFLDVPQTHYTMLDTWCPRCDPEFVPGEPVNEERMQGIRMAVLTELQRLHRKGLKLEGTITLENPVYGAP